MLGKIGKLVSIGVECAEGDDCCGCDCDEHPSNVTIEGFEGEEEALEKKLKESMLADGWTDTPRGWRCPVCSGAVIREVC